MTTMRIMRIKMIFIIKRNEFGSPDIYDVQELIELCLEDPGIDIEHNAQHQYVLFLYLLFTFLFIQ